MTTKIRFISNGECYSSYHIYGIIMYSDNLISEDELLGFCKDAILKETQYIKYRQHVYDTEGQEAYDKIPYKGAIDFLRELIERSYSHVKIIVPNEKDLECFL